MASANTIDISEFQDPSTFDYQAAKDAGINTIIIRGSVSMRLDKHAKEHIANAKKYGFHWHLYHYYYGGSGEADYAVQAAQELGLSSSQYLFLDMEDSSLPTDWATPFEAFRQKAKSHFKVGLYCSDSPYQAKFNDTTLKQEGVARWVASYSYEPKNYDIWQMSGAGSGGFGTYTGDVDRDYDKAGVLTSNSSSDQPKTPTGPANPDYRAIILEDGIDTDAGIYGRGCSYDNGKTFKVYWTPYGRKYYQEDGDRIWPFIKDKISGGSTGPVSSQIEWANILDKPDLVTEEELADKLASYTPISNAVDWSNVTNKPDLSKFLTHDDLDGYATEAELANIKMQKGDKGDPGRAATVHVGTVTEGDTPSVTNVGTDTDAVLDFVLPASHGSSGTSTGDQITVDAIADVIKSHVSFNVDAKTGELTMQTTDIKQDSLVDQVAASIASHLQFKVQDNDLVMTVGGDS